MYYKIKLINDTIKVVDIVEDKVIGDEYLYATEAEYNMINPSVLDTSDISTQLDL